MMKDAIMDTRQITTLNTSPPLPSDNKPLPPPNAQSATTASTSPLSNTKPPTQTNKLSTTSVNTSPLQPSNMKPSTNTKPQPPSETKPPTPTEYKSESIYRRLMVDAPYRRRFIHTLWLYWALMGLGWSIGQMGPTFPDLREITNQSLETASLLFTLGAVGYLIGSLIGGVLYDRYNKLMLLFFSLLLLAASSAVLPWCSYFPVMVAVKFLAGLGSGGLDTGGNADIVSIWNEEGRSFNQAFHFCFGFGGILSPLVSEPFLAKTECVPHASNDSDITTLVGNNTPETNSSSMSNSSTSLTSTPTPCVEVLGQSSVHYAYLITGVLILSSAVPFLVMYISSLNNDISHHEIITAAKLDSKRTDKLPLKLKVTLLIFLSSYMLTYCAVEDTFSGFLATFCVSQFKWGKDTSSFATSLLWASMSLGRLSGIFVVRHIKPINMLRVHGLALIGSFIGLLLASLTHTIPLVWVFIFTAGFSMSVIFACIFTWTEESILQVTGKISAMFLVSSSSGLMINPLFLGYLMDNFTPMWLIYLLLGESVLCFMFFQIICLILKHYLKSLRVYDVTVMVGP